MTKNEGPPEPRLVGSISVPPHVEREFALCVAMDRLAPSLIALRLAMDAAAQAPGALCIILESTTPDDIVEFRRRWVAASQLMNGAVKAVEATGADMIAAVRDLLAV